MENTHESSVSNPNNLVKRLRQAAGAVALIGVAMIGAEAAQDHFAHVVDQGFANIGDAINDDIVNSSPNR